MIKFDQIPETSAVFAHVTPGANLKALIINNLNPDGLQPGVPFLHTEHPEHYETRSLSVDSAFYKFSNLAKWLIINMFNF
jgi:hypothetical protein